MPVEALDACRAYFDDRAGVAATARPLDETYEAGQIETMGSEVRTETRVLGIIEGHDEVVVESTQGTFRAPTLVNCASCAANSSGLEGFIGS